MGALVLTGHITYKPDYGRVLRFPEDVEISPREARLTERERQVLSYLALAWETRYMQDAGNFRGMVLQDSELETGLLSGVHQSRHSAKSWFRFCA